MEKDIVPELLETLKKDFNDTVANNKIIADKSKKLLDGKVNFNDVYDVSHEVGNTLKNAFKNNIKKDILPNGKMYYNIANRTVKPKLKEAHEMISSYGADVQGSINKNKGINVKGVKAKFNEEKVDNLVNKLCEYDDYDDAKWLLDENVKNYCNQSVDETIRANADFLSESGFKETISRSTNGGCCEWCEEVSGVFDYDYVKQWVIENPDHNVFSRHRYCNCIIGHNTEKGRKVVNNQWNEEKHERQKRKEFSTPKNYKKFYEGEQVNKYFEKESKMLWTKENNEAREAFTEYTQSGYININSALRNRKEFMNSNIPFYAKEKTFQNIKHMKNFIDKQELKEDIIVYRSVDKSVIENQIGLLTNSKGKTFVEEGFSSTSTLQECVKGFYAKDKSICIEYHIPNGKGRGAYINSVSEFRDKEYEFLLNTETKAKIIGFKKENDMDVVIMEALDYEID